METPIPTEPQARAPFQAILERVAAATLQHPFEIQQERSLTVHLEHAGEYSVFSHDDEGNRVHIGEYWPTFASAMDARDAANGVWRYVPKATSAEVAAIING